MKSIGFMVTVFLVLLTASAVSAQARTVHGIESIESGLYRITVDKIISDDASVSGAKKIANKIQLYEKTAQVPAKIGVTFGFRYVIHGEPQGEPIVLTEKIIHPLMINPETNESGTIYHHQIRKMLGAVNWTGFSFHRQWELVPGEYIFRYYHQDKMLFEKVFTVFTANEEKSAKSNIH